MLTLSIETLSRTTIDMSSTESFDDSGVVKYQFICCAANNWQTVTNYVAAVLDINAHYSYQVKALGAAGNETMLR